MRLLADAASAGLLLTGVTFGLAASTAGAASSSSHGKAKTIRVSTDSIAHVGTVLTTASGLTLYRFTQDAAGKTACTGVCAKLWPLLSAVKGEHVQGPKGVNGLAVVNVGHGRWQVAFHHDPLYRYIGDKKKGQAHGQAFENTWFAVLKSGVPAASAAVGTTTTGAAGSSTVPPSSTTVAPHTTGTSPSQVMGGSTSPATAPPPVATTTPVTSPPTTPPTTTPTTQPPVTTTTVGGGGYGY